MKSSTNIPSDIRSSITGSMTSSISNCHAYSGDCGTSQIIFPSRPRFRPQALVQPFNQFFARFFAHCRHCLSPGYWWHHLLSGFAGTEPRKLIGQLLQQMAATIAIMLILLLCSWYFLHQLAGMA